MLSFKPYRHSWCLSAALFAALTVLSACGFSPVHGSLGDDAGSSNAVLRQIDIALVPDRQGQILRNHLIDLFGGQRPGKSRYSLTSEISLSKEVLGTQLDATTTRSRLTVRVVFGLFGGGAKKTFNVSSVASYSTSESDYATLVAERDALDRALRAVALDARRRILIYLDKNG